MIFVFYFGLPSWEKYQAGEVMNSRRKVINKGNSSVTPALTVCAIYPEIHHGWKYDVWFKRHPKYSQLSKYGRKSLILKHSDLINLCNETTDVQDCVEKSTYNLEETIERASAYSPTMGKIDFYNSASWTEEFTFLTGLCHTFNKTIPLDSVGHWKVDFKRKLDYSVAIHDPNYFMMSANPATIPSIAPRFNSEDQGKMLTYIEAIRHINIDRPDQPCTEQSGYSFTACVKNSLSRKVGCRYLNNKRHSNINISLQDSMEYMEFSLMASVYNNATVA